MQQEPERSREFVTFYKMSESSNTDSPLTPSGPNRYVGVGVILNIDRMSEDHAAMLMMLNVSREMKVPFEDVPENYKMIIVVYPSQRLNMEGIHGVCYAQKKKA
jgi:hypothetical protein